MASTAWILVYIIVILNSGAGGTEHHRRLLSDLLNADRYDRSVRPVRVMETTTQVSIYLNVHQIRDLHEQSQYLESLVWITFRWRDEFLTWNESEYGGVHELHVESTRIWRPDVVLYNSVDDSRSAIKIFSETNAVINSTGDISWMTTALFKSSCDMDISRYPFDTQRCLLRFGSWTFVTKMVNLTCWTPFAGNERLVDNGEWNIDSIPCEHHERVYNCCDESFADTTFRIVIHRRPMFYLYNLLFPCVCLIIVGLLVFWLPPESGEKTSLAVTVLLAMTVFMLVIMDHVPPTSEVVPLLDKFFGATTALLSLSSVFAVMVVNCHHKGADGRPPPVWMRRYIIGYLGHVLFERSTCVARVRGEYRYVSPDEAQPPDTTSNKMDDSNSSPIVLKPFKENSSTCNRSTNSGIEEKHLDDPKLQVLIKMHETTTTTLHAILRQLEETRQEQSSDGALQSEWRAIAKILDRAFLLVFIILTIVITLWVFVFH